MSFTAPKFTDAGKALQLRALAGERLTFTRIGVGDGELTSGSIADLTELIHSVIDVNISSVSHNESACHIRGAFTNASVETGFYWRELGLYAADPDYPNDRSKDILYCYQNAYTLAEYIASGSSSVIEKTVCISSLVGDASNVTALIDASLVFVTKQEFDEALKNKAPSEHSHEISNVNGLQAALNNKAPKSHGTHVTYGTTAPKAAGTASAGSAETVSRSDHVHPEQTNVTGNAGSANKVDTVSVTPQEATATLFPAFVDSNNSAATPEEINTTSGLRISVLYGTVDKTGHVILALGTGVPEGTDKNVIGGLRLYTQGAGFVDLKPSEASDDNFSILLPTAEGRLALDTPASATAAGLVNTAAQTFAGAKTFNGPVYPNGATDLAVPQARKLASGSAEANDTNCPPGSWYGQHV